MQIVAITKLLCSKKKIVKKHHFRPLFLTVNGLAKRFPKSNFEDWYAKNIEAQINRGISVYSVEVQVIGVYDHMRNNPEMIKEGF